MVAPVFYPYPPVQPEGVVNAKLALAMKNAGWCIDVIVASGFKGSGGRYPVDKTNWKELANSIHVIKLEHCITRARRLLNVLQGFLLTGRPLRGLGWGLSALKVAKKLTSKSNYDIIISRAIPDYAHIAALLIHKHAGIPWIANWNDPTPNHKFPPPYGKGPASSLSSDRRDWYQAICEQCSWHTFPSERLREYMCSYLPGQLKTKSSTIPHVATEKFSFAPVSHNGFSVCYAGSVSPPREITVFLEGAKRFSKIIKNTGSFHVRFIVDRPDIVADCATNMGIGDIIKIEASRPYSQMPQALAKSDVLVIIEAPLTEGIFMPGKLVDYVQIGRPILALSPVVGTINDIVSKHGGGIAVNCQSPDLVARALRTLHEHWSEGNLNRLYGSTRLASLFSEERVLGLYMDLFEKIKNGVA
jgi:glycosyltransferase involved in cell wall biosynthesis